MKKDNVCVPENEPEEVACADGYGLVCNINHNTDKALAVILTQVEATLGETKQAEAFKKLIRHEFWRLKDFNQHAIYLEFGQEKWDYNRSHEPNDEVTMPINEKDTL